MPVVTTKRSAKKCCRADHYSSNIRPGSDRKIKRFALSEIAEAHEYVESRKARGRVVVTL
jgi:hypothetical protein